MNTIKYIEELKKLEGIIAICQFGSYGSDYWIKDRSDIDLAVITAPNINYMHTLKLEDDILSISKEFYNYNNIQLTFVLFNEFNNKYARMAIDSGERFIVNDEKWYDFQHYVLKYARNNERLEKMLKIDEQYSYFGGIIDESIL